MPAVKYRAERTCCDDDAPVGFDTVAKEHYHKGTGTWVRSACCGKVHWARRLSAEGGQ